MTTHAPDSNLAGAGLCPRPAEVRAAEQQRLLEMLDEARHDLEAQRGREVVGLVLDGLVAAAKIHFAHEEHDLERRGDPDAVPHTRQHDELIRQIIALRYRFQATGGTGVGADAINALRDRLVAHFRPR